MQRYPELDSVFWDLRECHSLQIPKESATQAGIPDNDGMGGSQVRQWGLGSLRYCFSATGGYRPYM